MARDLIANDYDTVTTFGERFTYRVEPNVALGAAWQIGLLTVTADADLVRRERFRDHTLALTSQRIEDDVQTLHLGAELAPGEDMVVRRVPEIAAQLLANIPRMEEVQSILMYQNAGYDGQGSPVPSVLGERIPLGARLIKAATDFDMLESRGLSAAEAISVMQAHASTYDPNILRTLHEMQQGLTITGVVRQMAISEVLPGMVFAQDIVDTHGTLLVARGQEASESLLRHLHDYQDPALQARRVLVMTPSSHPEARTAA